MAKARKLPRIVDRALFSAIDVARIKKMKREGEPRDSLIREVEDNLEALVDAVDTGKGFMGRYPEDQELMELVKCIIEWAIGEVNPETFVNRALRL